MNTFVIIILKKQW